MTHPGVGPITALATEVSTVQPLPMMTPSIVNPVRSLFDQSA